MPHTLVCVCSATERESARVHRIFDAVEAACAHQFPDLTVSRGDRADFAAEYLASIEYSGKPCFFAFVTTDEAGEVTFSKRFGGPMTSLPEPVLAFVGALL